MTTTTNLGLTLPAVGADADTWGAELNTDLGQIDAFAGSLMPQAEVVLASGAVTDIGSAISTVVAITGTTTITGFGTGANKIRFVRFTGALTLTHNATSLILLGGVNRATAAGDCGIYQSDGSGNWRERSYFASGYNPASHSGTGAYAHINSPSFSSPNMGSAIASDLSINGATLGSNKLAVNGNALIVGDTTGAHFVALGSGGGNYQAIGFGITCNHDIRGVSNNDYIDIVATSNGVRLPANSTGWTSISDERIKTDLIPITDAGLKVDSLRAVTGRYKTDPQNVRRSFLIAQDVQAVFPEAVREDENGSGRLWLGYTDVIPLLVAAMKEAGARIAALEARIP